MYRKRLLITVVFTVILFGVISPCFGPKPGTLDKGLLFETWAWERASDVPKNAIIGNKAKTTLEDIFNIMVLEAILNDQKTFALQMWKAKMGGEWVMASATPGTEVAPGVRVVVVSLAFAKAKTFIGLTYSSATEMRFVKQDGGQWVQFKQPMCVKNKEGADVHFLTGKPCGDPGSMGDMMALGQYLREHVAEMKFTPLLVSAPLAKSANLAKAVAPTGSGPMLAIPAEVLQEKVTWKQTPSDPTLKGNDILRAIKNAKSEKATGAEILNLATLEALGSAGKTVQYMFLDGSKYRSIVVVAEPQPEKGMQTAYAGFLQGEGSVIRHFDEIRVVRNSGGKTEVANLPLCQTKTDGTSVLFFSDEPCPWSPLDTASVPDTLSKARRYIEEKGLVLDFAPLQ